MKNIYKNTIRKKKVLFTKYNMLAHSSSTILIPIVSLAYNELQYLLRVILYLKLRRKHILYNYDQEAIETVKRTLVTIIHDLSPNLVNKRNNYNCSYIPKNKKHYLAIYLK